MTQYGSTSSQASDDKIGSKLADVLAGGWSALALLPAFKFFGGGLLVWILSHDWKSFVEFFEPLSVGEKFFYAAIAFFLLAISSSLLEWYTLPYLRLLEGYWPSFLDKRRQKKINKFKDKLQKYKKQYGNLNALRDRGLLSSSDKQIYFNLDRKLSIYYPKSDHQLLPTKLGNILRAAEEYPYINYGLDFYFVWSQLWLILPSDVQKEIRDARQILNMRTRLVLWASLFLIWAILPFVRCPRDWGLATALVAVVTIAVALLAWRITYQGLCSAAVSYGELNRAVFDLYRFELYRKLHWPQPTSPETEFFHGQKLTEYLRQHSSPLNMHFVDSDASSEQLEDLEFAHTASTSQKIDKEESNFQEIEKEESNPLIALCNQGNITCPPHPITCTPSNSSYHSERVRVSGKDLSKIIVEARGK